MAGKLRKEKNRRSVPASRETREAEHISFRIIKIFISYLLWMESLAYWKGSIYVTAKADR